MKKIILTLVMCFSFAAQADLVSQSYDSNPNVDFETEVRTMYSKELKKENSNLSLALSAFANKNDLSFNEEFDSERHYGDMSVDFDSMFASYSGRSGAHSSSSSLIPIRASMAGSGLIENIIGFLEVSHSFDMSAEFYGEKISIDGIIAFGDQ